MAVLEETLWRPARATVSLNSIFIHWTLLNRRVFSVYYRVYAEDGAIPSVNRAYTDDPYLGRIPAEFVAPPPTVANLKRCLSGVENIDKHTAVNLFLSASSQMPMADDRRVSNPGPGCQPTEPMALAIMGSETSVNPASYESKTDPILPPEGTSPFEPQYSKHFEDSRTIYFSQINYCSVLQSLPSWSCSQIRSTCRL